MKQLILSLLLVGISVRAETFFISPSGSDSNDGKSAKRPFALVQTAIDAMSSGDTLVLGNGTYSGSLALKSGITLRAANPRNVVFSGAEPVESGFERVSGKLYRAKIDRDVKQVFYDGVPLSWARWPNCSWAENREAAKKWVVCGEGSEPGAIVSERFAELTDLDLEGAYCFIRYSLGNSCYSRAIESFDGKTLRWNDDDFYKRSRSGGDGINAPPELAASVSNEKYAPESSRFFLAGSKALLDAPGEWFIEEGWLYLMAPDGSDPNKASVLMQQQDFVISSEDALTDVSIDGVDFFATSIHLPHSDNMNIAFKNSRFTYIGAELLFNDRLYGRAIDKPIRVSGRRISFQNCLFAGSHNSALKLRGSDLVVHNCVFIENNRHANFESRALYLEPEGFYRVTRNTFFNNGSDTMFIVPDQEKMPETVRPDIGYNHIFNGGLYNTDCSGVYMPSRSQRFASVHHNWMHNVNGVAMRVDLAGMELNVHHNVFWESGKAISLEGYRDFNVYNNTDVHNRTFSVIIKNIVDHSTVKGEGSRDMSFPPIDDWNVVNNLMERFFDKAGSRDMDLYRKSYEAGTTHPIRNHKSLMSVKDLGQVQGNLVKFDLSVFKSADLDHLDLRPAHARQVRNGVKQTATLKAQEVNELDEFRGAYDAKGDYWWPGCNWMPYGLPVIKTMAEAERFAKEYGRVSIVPKVGEQGLWYGALSLKGER